MKFRSFSSKGAALPTVIMVMLVVMTSATIVLSLTTSQAKTGVIYEDNIQALHSAEAGLNQYLWYLNKEGATLKLDTVVTYPESDPESAFIIKELENTNMQKIINVTGWSLRDPDTTRTIEATFTQRSFTQYVYFSENDPSNIWWMDGDKCFGPYHTNTSLSISGSPEFFDKVTYVNQIVYQSGVTSNPKFYAGNERVAAVGYPNTNKELMNYAAADGYVYQGRTSIRLNADGTITVWNPNSGSNAVTRPLPSNGVIYVNGTSVTNASARYNLAAGNVFISGVLNGRLTVAAANDIYITDYDPTYESYSQAQNHETNGISYANTDFTVNTSTGDITVTGSGQEDMLGLIADKNVSVLTYGWFDKGDFKAAKGDIKVYAAVFAINGSFGNSYNMYSDTGTSYPNPYGTLSVRGAIIQNQRGVVGIRSDKSYGYVKDYAHDIRMKYESPPYFPVPEDSGWEINTWKEK